MKRSILYIVLFLCLPQAVLTSCMEEFAEENVIPDGEGTVAAVVEFNPFRTALATRTAGNAIEEINSLCILVYDVEGRLLRKEPLQRKDAAADGAFVSPSTGHAEFSFPLPYGRYRIYAVANMGDMTGYEDDIRTLDGLKSIRLEWEDEVSGNCEMLGYFTVKGSDSKAGDVVVVDKKKVGLHAWVKRAASKVTVAYDASGLEEGVFIYLKSVQVKDIPSGCLLGKDNTPTSQEDTIRNGEKIVYYGGPDPDVYDSSYPGPRLSKGKPLYGDHGAASESMFFYENMQGEGGDKRQDSSGGADGGPDGKLDHPGLPGDAAYLSKDGKPYGTYVEVEAFYVSVNPDRVGSGPIKFRFMLGKDIYKDYNAERNYHYKLTLKFRGYANDADWHIEYEEMEPSIEVPNPYYISYLYNQKMMLPLKINAGNNTVTGIETTILENRWGPYEPNKDFVYWSKMDTPDNPWNGFLSLHETSRLVITGSAPFTALSNRPEYVASPDRGYRKYTDLSDGEHATAGSEATDKYIVRKEDGANVWHVQLPMYTRAKQLIKQTGYTGNNPYSAYRRKAVVRIKVTLSGGGTVEEDVTIFQVRRIINPKGVWRRHDNAEPFDVTLMHLPGENSTKFESFASEGPWKAYVMHGDKDFVSLEGGASSDAAGTIYGLTGSDVKFTINFNGPCGEKESRYALINVLYHNYTCEHLIFVRQGDAPDELIPGGTRWHSKNMVTAEDETSDLTEEGSLFKFGNWDYPIDASNNNHLKVKEYWVNVVPGDFQNESWKDFVIAGSSETKKWREIIPLSTETGTFAMDDASTWRVTSYKDFETLYNHPDIAEGYGIMYGDNASSVAVDINEAYGLSGEKAAMRGCFVYNKATGHNLFFPIGASGYGHRKNEGKYEAEGKSAILRYGSRFAYFPDEPIGTAYPAGVDDAPLFYDLYMRPGAVYWLDKRINDSPLEPGWLVGWDFNFFTFDFFPMGESVIKNDACFVRCVDK